MSTETNNKDNKYSNTIEYLNLDIKWHRGEINTLRNTIDQLKARIDLRIECIDRSEREIGRIGQLRAKETGWKSKDL